MKYRMLFLVFLLFKLASVANAQTVGDYRTAVSGNWNVISNWQRYSGAVSGWVTPTASPNNTNANVISIRNGHTITVTTGVNVDQVIVETTGQITINSGVTMVLANNALYNPDMIVNGILKNAGTVTTTGTLEFASGSKYQHNWTSGDTGTIPKATWDDGSTCEIIGFTSGVGTTKLQGTSQSFYDFVWNCPGQLQTVFIRGDSFRPVRNDFLMQNTGTSNCEVTAVSPGRLEFTNYIQSGGVFTISSGAVGYTVNVSGDITMTGGTLTTGATPSTIFFTKNGTQAFSNTGGIIRNYVDFVVRNSSTLDLGSSVLTSEGSFTMNLGSALITANSEGISLNDPIGSIQVTGVRSYSTEADYTYNGAVAQLTGDGLITANNLIIDNPAGVTLSNSTTINGVLYQVAGAISGSIHTDGYSAEAYNYLNIEESDDLINSFAISMTTPASLPQYVNRKWTIFGNYASEKIVTFYWTIADDNGFNWADFTPAVWKNGVSYLASSYEVTGEIRYITVAIPASLTRGEYVIGQISGTLPSIRVYAEQPNYYTSTSDVSIPVLVEGLEQSIRGFALDISFDPTYLNIKNLLDFEEGSFLSSNGLTQWYVIGENGQYNVTCTILGVCTGAADSGTLFTLTLSPQGQSTGVVGTDIILSNIILRDVMNQPVYAGTIENTNVVIDVTPIYANFTVFLQGPYVMGGSMTHNLGNNIPLVSPYILPGQSSGQIIIAYPNVSPFYIVDWVMVQLRTGTASSTTVQSANAFLLSNGALVDVLGNNSLPFFLTAGNQYYIVVKHRNHLAIMSAVSYSFSNDPANPTTINLSEAGSAYGANNGGFKLMQEGIYAMYAGDADGNGRIQANDRNNFWRVQTNTGGYKSADFNLNGLVQANDRNNFWRTNSNRSTLVPN
jgi:hypothetical protein